MEAENSPEIMQPQDETMELSELGVGQSPKIQYMVPFVSKKGVKEPQDSPDQKI